MEGIRSPIIKIVEIAKKYNAITYLDEVHSVGLYGEKGKGIAVEMKVDQDIDIINGTLAKAFGQMGGYIAATNEIIDYIRSFSPGFIFTTSICPSIAAGAGKAVEIVSLADQLRVKIHENATTMRQLLESIAIPYIDTNSHIISVMINDPFLCKKVSEKLMEVVGGVIWVWIPIFGINEVPSFTVILRGIVITSAVLFHGYGARKKREPVLP